MKGKWLGANNRPCSSMFKCSLCGKIAYFSHGSNHKTERVKECRYKFCPNCGADMRGE